MIIAVLIYVGAQLGFGFWVARRIATEDDYLLAGRSLGYGVGIFTVFATWFGAETCIGAAGEVYSHGLSGTRADPFGYGLCILLMGAVFAIPLWRRKLTTLADLFRQRYGTSVERVAVLLLVPTSVIWAAAQIRAFGQVLGAVSDWNIELTITIAGVVVVVYTTAGGLLADAYTDLLQGVVLIIGLAAVVIAVVASGDASAAASIPADRLSLVADESIFATLETWAIPIFGSVVAQELIARVLAARSPQVAQRATLAAGGLYLLVGAMPLFIGLLAAQTAPGLAEPEQVLIHQAGVYLPTVLYVVFAGALVSAILSTVDSALLVAGSLVAHNLVLPLRPDLGDRGKVRVNRIAVVCFGVIAYTLALGAEGVYALVETASSFGTSGVFVAVVFGLFTRFGGARSALAALLSGIAVYGAGTWVSLLDYPYITSLAAAFGAYVAFALIERPGAPRAAAS
jgi:Na+/proline symporter